MPGRATPSPEDGGGERIGEEVISALKRARSIASSELVPLTGHPRGAVVMDTEGRRAEGCSIEIPGAPRLGICAEHLALVSAVAEGLNPRVAAVWTSADDPTPHPCGVCRQVLAELAPDITLWIQRGDRPPEPAAARDLLPRPFDKTSLPKASGDSGRGTDT
jgi:cytidine deaminase